jgi:hypothetical protein
MRAMVKAAAAGAALLVSGIALAGPVALTVAYQGSDYHVKSVTVSQGKGNVHRDMFCKKDFCVVAFPADSGVKTIVSVRYASTKDHRYSKLRVCSNQFTAPTVSDAYMLELGDNGCRLVDQNLVSGDAAKAASTTSTTTSTTATSAS